MTAISGKASGFSIRERRARSASRWSSPPRASGSRSPTACPPRRRALATDSGETLADSPTYKEAVSALGGTPISGFVDGPAALHLAAALVPPDEEGFLEAKPYLTKIDYLAIGSGTSGELATAKLIAGIGDSPC